MSSQGEATVKTDIESHTRWAAEQRQDLVGCFVELDSCSLLTTEGAHPTPPPEAATHSGESSEPLAVMGPGQGFKLGYCSIPS